MRHDNKHCLLKIDKQNATPSYGDWIRAGGVSKGRPDRTRPPISRSNESSEDENIKGKVQTVAERGRDSAQTGSRNSETAKGSQSLNSEDMVMSDTLPGENMMGWDRTEIEIQNSKPMEEAHEGQKETNGDLVSDLFKRNEDAFLSVGPAKKPTKRTQEVNSPIRKKIRAQGK